MQILAAGEHDRVWERGGERKKPASSSEPHKQLKGGSSIRGLCGNTVILTTLYRTSSSLPTIIYQYHFLHTHLSADRYTTRSTNYSTMQTNSANSKQRQREKIEPMKLEVLLDDFAVKFWFEEIYWLNRRVLQICRDPNILWLFRLNPKTFLFRNWRQKQLGEIHLIQKKNKLHFNCTIRSDFNAWFIEQNQKKKLRPDHAHTHPEFQMHL